LQEATTADPTFALAFAKLALLHVRWYDSFLDRTPRRLVAARAAADSALRLDPNSPDGCLALGRYYEAMDDITTASVHYSVAEQGRPNDATILVASAAALSRSGSWSEGLKRFRRAADLDPRAITVQLAAANAYLMSRDYAAAAQYVDRAISADSSYVDAHVMKAVVALLAGDWPRARRFAHSTIQRFGAARVATSEWSEELVPGLDAPDLEALERVPQAAFAGSPVVYNYWRAHLFERWQPARARAHADTLLRAGSQMLVEQPDNRRVRGASGWGNGFVGNREVAISDTRRALTLATQARDAHAFAETGRHAVYTFLRIGEYDAALELIDQLLKVPSLMSVGVLRNDPLMAPLRSKPRFQQLLRGT
jgi:tetratricopeptide (TPR) repeat protein